MICFHQCVREEPLHIPRPPLTQALCRCREGDFPGILTEKSTSRGAPGGEDKNL